MWYMKIQSENCLAVSSSKKGAEAKGHQVNMVQSLRRLYEKWRYLCIKKMTWLKYSECFGKQMYLYWLLRFIFMESVPRLKNLHLTALILSGSILVKKKFTILYRLVWARTSLKDRLVIWMVFVEHLEEYKIAGKIYAANVMDAGISQKSKVFSKKPMIWDIPFKMLRIESWRIKLIKNKG